MRIFSGIQPTGRKHLGNYIGAIRQYVEGQDRGDRRSTASSTCTRSRSPTTRPSCASALYDTTAILLAAGLDPERCILFRQSDVREHTELTWLLSAVTAHGDLNRMHQFKEKSAKQRELVSAALFFYPVLQAADVLAYRADEVPVGDDQRQHVELMREIARRFNERFGETLVVPGAPDPRGRGADHGPAGPGRRRCRPPAAAEQGTVYVLDEPDAVRKKLGSAVTDSGAEVAAAPRQARDHEPDRDPRRGPRRRARARSSASSTGPGYGDFKGAVAEAVVELPGAGPRALRRAAPRRGGARARSSPRAPRRRARSPPATLADVRERDGRSARAAVLSRSPRLRSTVR